MDSASISLVVVARALVPVSATTSSLKPVTGIGKKGCAFAPKANRIKINE